MAGPVNSILLVDCDSLRRSLAAVAGSDAAAQLPARLDEWLGAIESGELAPVGPRMFDVKRCYVTTATNDGDAFAAAGFYVVRHESGGPVDMRLVVDAMDAMMTADTGTEFILLTAAPDLTPLVERLKGGRHRVTVYADDNTAADYRAAANAVITAEDFATILVGKVAPQAEAEDDKEIDRARIEAFAREIHAATNIPLFSPRIFSELFRTLSEEVSTRGYHFQDTAKNVAEALSRAGRTITSRQVVFVVKGLALKGHVFSTDDTPERLAEVFREQARYLIGNAGIAMTPERERILAAWVAAPAGSARAGATPAKPTARTGVRKPTSERVQRRTPPEKPQPPQQQERAAQPAPQAAQPSPEPARPSPQPRPSIARPRSTALPTKPATPPKPQVKQPTAAELRAAIAARIQAAARQRQALRTAPPAKEEPEPAPPAPPARAARPPAQAAAPKPEGHRDLEDPIESSILAAIAEAVDVLVDDDEPPHEEESFEDDAPFEDEPPARQPRRPEPEPEPPPEESDDLGDEIQRIVASYSRNRPPGEK